jgi:hypothetical protein
MRRQWVGRRCSFLIRVVFALVVIMELEAAVAAGGGGAWGRPTAVRAGLR